MLRESLPEAGHASAERMDVDIWKRDLRALMTWPALWTRKYHLELYSMHCLINMYNDHTSDAMETHAWLRIGLLSCMASPVRRPKIRELIVP